MADDFNYWMTGYYPALKTPNLDSLASMGIMFTEAHCTSPVCNPSRNAIWSGYRPSTTRIWTNSNNPDGDYVRDVPGFENIVTMHQYFKENGYFAFGGGKLYHDGKMGSTKTDPTHWSQLTTQNTGSPGGPFYEWSHPDATVSFKAGEFPYTNAGDTQLANEVADLISNYANSPNSGQPFFIGCGFFRPHLPWNCHKDFYDLYDPEALPFPDGFLAGDLNDISYTATSEHLAIVNNNQWKNAIRAYLANSTYADYNVGIVLDALRNSPYADSTIIVFMGDHGWHLGEKERWKKSSVFDQAFHTTLIIYDPSAPGNGQVCSKVVSLQDLYPTLVELTGLPTKNSVEGRSIAPLIEDPARTDWDFPIYMTYAGTNIVKTNEWRFIDDGNESQLYHTSIDPYEWTNLYGKAGYEAITNTLQSYLDNLMTNSAIIRNNLLNGTDIDPSLATPKRTYIINTMVTDSILRLDLLYAAPVVDLKILTIKGDLVFETEVVGESEISVQLDGIVPGTYLLEIISEGVPYVERFVVQ